MFNISQPYTGHYYEAEWLEYDETTKKFKIPVKIRIKGKEAGIGVDTNNREIISTRESGRWVEKNVFTVDVLDYQKYKPRDKVRFIFEDNVYVVHRVTPRLSNINSMSVLMFPNKQSNQTYILYLGDN